MTREVRILLVTFGHEHEQAARALLTTTAARLFPGAAIDVTVVDNASPEGDNRVGEFSGWDRGLSLCGAALKGCPPTIVILANDTVVRPEKRARVEATPMRCAKAAADGALAGLVEEYPHSVDAFGYRFRQFLDTSFLIGRAETFASLAPLAQPLADDEVFGDDWREFFREPSPLGESYRAYLRAYFFGDTNAGGQGPPDEAIEDFAHRWHNCEPVSARNFEAFKAKLRCVFCEHLLSARAMARGIPLVDIRPNPIAVARPRVSVVIPCFNLGDYVEEAVDSVLAQTYQDFEIVVVDDASTDARTHRTLDLLLREKTRVIRARHGGLAATRNLGIARTTGAYVCALDADDRLRPTFLEQAVARLDRDPSIAFVSSWLKMFEDDDFEWTPESWDFPALLREDTVLTAALVRREALVAAGAYDTAMPVQGDEDWDLWLTLVERGCRGDIIREVLFDYRKRNGSMSDVSWYGDGHVPLANYRFDKHRDAYRRHLVDVLLFQDGETAGLLRRNDELERHIHSHLEPAIAARRDELAALKRAAGSERTRPTRS
jgi:glycosyltransferase involved in cell wall biosynthesis